MGIDRTGIPKIVIVPDIIKDLLPGQGDPLILQKIGQQLKLLIAKLDLLAINRRLMGRFVDGDPAGLQYLIGADQVGTAQDRAVPT
jgi:hypothetical protein